MRPQALRNASATRPSFRGTSLGKRLLSDPRPKPTGHFPDAPLASRPEVATHDPPRLTRLNRPRIEAFLVARPDRHARRERADRRNEARA